MREARKEKPIKKTDSELNQLLAKKIPAGEYVFLKHARERLIDRNISDLDVLDILEGKIGYKKNRNKIKDKYVDGKQDWNYCFEGCNIDGIEIRIIISFDGNLMPIITVIRLN
ncbi:MAG: DUF4258 domain-containing protein [Proteobacteria bacterium]|nr:DUF4258 domain-containing protein [Pseudomonadota bacterium]